MPTYDYLCPKCRYKQEVFHRMSEEPEILCPACKKDNLKKQISGGGGILFKGSGFYSTDYASPAYKAAKANDKGSSIPTTKTPISE